MNSSKKLQAFQKFFKVKQQNLCCVWIREYLAGTTRINFLQTVCSESTVKTNDGQNFPKFLLSKRDCHRKRPCLEAGFCLFGWWCRKHTSKAQSS